MTARRYLVTGRVQGVGFRYFVEAQARRLGVCGWVRNRADGAVEVLAVAGDDVLAELRALLEEGPPSAKVISVVETAARGEGEQLTRFARLPTR